MLHPYALQTAPRRIKRLISHAASRWLVGLEGTVLVLDPKWDMETDVVIVGYGSSGAVAALTAAEAGAKVLILEKQRQGLSVEVGNHFSTSHMSGGVYLQPTDYAGTIKYFRAMSRVESGHGVMTTPNGWSGDDLIEAYTVEALHNKEWLDERGFTLEKIGEGAEHNLPGWRRSSRIASRTRASG